jgi:hypothetical protein
MISEGVEVRKPTNFSRVITSITLTIILIICAGTASAQNAGVFSKGNKHIGVIGGLGHTLNQDYLILGGDFGYFVVDGLEVSLAGEGWLLQTPSIWKVTPQIRYTVFQMQSMHPYVGAFYRHTFIGDPFDDFDSWGGKAGVSYKRGRNMISLGLVHEKYMDCEGDNCSNTYPEMAFWIAF